MTVLQQKLAIIERSIARMIDTTAELAYDDTMKQLRDSGVEHEVINAVSTVTKEHFKNLALRNIDGLMKTIEYTFNNYVLMVTEQSQDKKVEQSPPQQKEEVHVAQAKRSLEDELNEMKAMMAQLATKLNEKAKSAPIKTPAKKPVAKPAKQQEVVVQEANKETTEKKIPSVKISF